MAGWHDFILAALSPFNTHPIPFNIRWRAFIFQPLAYIMYGIKYLPWCRPFRGTIQPPYTVHFAKMRDGFTQRFIVFSPSHHNTITKVPLHIDFHGGAFIGGLAEYDAEFLAHLSSTLPNPTLIVGIEYRCAPRWIFPTAHHDAVDVVKHITSRLSEGGSGLVEKYNLDLECITLSGFSAGGNLAYSTAVKLSRVNQALPSQSEPMIISHGVIAKGVVTFYSHLDFTVPRLAKKFPASVQATKLANPSSNPLDALAGDLMDFYIPQPASSEYITLADGIYSPVNASLEEIPKRLLFIVPQICPLVSEQRKLFDKVTGDEGKERGFKAEWLPFENGFHGWLEVPERFINVQDKRDAFKAAVNFIVEVQNECGH